MGFKETMCRFGMTLKKNSPTILAIGGGAAIIGGTIWACVKSTKVPDILEDHASWKDDILADHDEALESVKDDEVERVANIEAATKKEIRKLYFRTFKKLVRLYSWPVVIEVLGLVAMGCSVGELKKRNAALASAYAGCKALFDFYRKNVKETFGEDIDRDMFYGFKHEKETVETIDENGKKVKKKEDVLVMDKLHIENLGNYIMWEGNCPGFENNTIDYWAFYLRGQVELANSKLVANGHLYLNKLFQLFCMKETESGNYLGWLNKKDYGDLAKDDRVIVGMTRCKIRDVDTVTGEVVYRPAIALDINVDGYIYDKVKFKHDDQPDLDDVVMGDVIPDPRIRDI